jgi:amidase
MSSILSTEPWLRDPYVVTIPWRQQIVDDTLARATETGASNEKRPLKFGVVWNDGMVTPHPPVVRGLREVVNAVEAAGHKVCFSRDLDSTIWLRGKSKTNAKIS